ncbi:hypothetical protein KBP30_41195 [Streptomyces sp. Go40/10]|uniref:hypothetical protein n=1 Tax=Streptomyces sp. Go40/10 TaxID=2825844 RepID=UPI001E4CFA46|nr:hypothetical protein [Streptomyces sp. Go40/10]UFR07156.1 hypothetical protein KBP30_41195 [Streptomyces sp. Go40/10]
MSAAPGVREPARPGMGAAGRYHLLLASGGRAVQHGWWHREDVARDKFRRWIGEYGSMPDARITLTDDETSDVMATWPDQQ